MNQERQKTDAIADAVEIPEGATHTVPSFSGEDMFVKFTEDSAFVWCDYDSMPNRWRKLHYVNNLNIDIYKQHSKRIYRN